MDMDHKSRGSLLMGCKLKILMLHGFCQSGPFFRKKTRAFTQALETECPDGVEFFYPTGPLNLWDLLDEPVAEAEARSDFQCWGKNLDIVNRYCEVDETIAYLSEYIAQYGPFDGVIGFSQGAAIALMLASLCEKTPGRTTALQDQAAPLLSQPPQQPFTFAIAVSGFKGLQPYFDGFYEPKIATPSLHAIADWDTVIDAWETEALAAACEDTKIIRHPGAHVFPSHGPALRQMLDFVHDHVTPQRSDLDIEVPDFIISWRGLPSRHRTSSPSATAVLSEKSMLRPSMTVRSLSAGSTSSVDTTISTLSSSTDHSQSRRPWHVGRNYRSRRVIRVHNV